MSFDQGKAPVTVLLGAQWGDEGKGKIIDYLIAKDKVQVVARCQGGNNAGHTVVANGQKYDFHIIPSGVIAEKCFNIIGNGTVVNLDSFFQELSHNKITSIPGWEDRILISDRAHIVCGVHMLVDGHSEEKLEINKIGTTKRGIGPAYSSKCFRNGLRVGDLVYDFEGFCLKFQELVRYYQEQYPGIEIDVDTELTKFKKHADKLHEMSLVGDTIRILDELRSSGKSVLVEGANGTMLDIDFGTYPFVTSSNATVGGALTGLGLPPTSIKRVIGVAKAYATRVGSGPFPTELKNEIGDKLQQLGHELLYESVNNIEVGVTTGRKRRCGWIDLFLLKRSHLINGFTDIALTKLDVLDTFDEIKAAVSYKLDGKLLKSPPSQAADWDRLEVDYQSFKGWNTSVSDIRDYNRLPENCRKFIEFIEQYIRVPVTWIGVGEERESLILR
ncbi:unnamed protein product [Thelazia callipaeda]|uniref:Adenylosuccinate synthetase n=1 Tax=Thelazia callipaeda TaxID=103827 RepID=A0A0N5D6I0_THECL|nr:unnamed protein product [Thelazia callipaeda]